jgi:hypothetical protein
VIVSSSINGMLCNAKPWQRVNLHVERQELQKLLYPFNAAGGLRVVANQPHELAEMSARKYVSALRSSRRLGVHRKERGRPVLVKHFRKLPVVKQPAVLLVCRGDDVDGFSKRSAHKGW